MPTSHMLQINEIIQLITITNPKRIMDIGVGFGKYGYLSREYLELWDRRERYHEWNRRIDGIEVFKDYITPIHEYIYDTIHIGDAVDILPQIKQEYDLILLIDVLEHFNHSDGEKLLQACEKRGRNMLIATPKEIGIQGPAFGNPHETHRFRWQKRHFNKYAHKFFLSNVESLIIFIGEDSRDVLKRLKKRKVDLIFTRRIVSILETFNLKTPIKRLLTRFHLKPIENSELRKRMGCDE